jgi:hypothetical protein
LLTDFIPEVGEMIFLYWHLGTSLDEQSNDSNVKVVNFAASEKRHNCQEHNVLAL